MTGLEYLNIDVLKTVSDSLNRSFAKSIKSFDGTVEQFIKSHGREINLIGRILLTPP